MEQIGSSSLSQLSGADRAIEAALAEHDTAECNCSTDGYCKGGTEMGTISRSIATPSATIRRAYKKKSIETAEGNNGTGEKEALQEGSGKRGKWQFGNGGAAECGAAAAEPGASRAAECAAAAECSANDECDAASFAECDDDSDGSDECAAGDNGQRTKLIKQ